MRRFAVLIILSILVLIITVGCKKQEFEGNITNDAEQFVLDYTILNKTITHNMDLEDGTVIDVRIEADSGRVDILVTSAAGGEIYKGNNASSGSFTIKIPAAGTYNFSVTGNKAKGAVSFVVRN